MLVKANDFSVANQVDTERPLSTGIQHLSIINLHLPLRQVSAKGFTMSPELIGASTMLMTFALLPDEADGQVHWQQINPDTIAPQRREVPATFIDTSYRRLARYHSTGGRSGEDNDITRSADVKPVIYRDGHYWTPRGYTLTEIFLVCPVLFALPVDGDNVTISVRARPFSRAQFTESWKIGHEFYTNGRHSNIGFLLASKLLLDKQLPDGMYSFYTAGTNIMDGNSFYAGAGDFCYKLGVGLVSGSYTTHLARRNSTATFITKRITSLK